MNKPFYLENRYQDGGWERLDENFENFEVAVLRAAILCQNSIVYGMVRVCQLYRHGDQDHNTVLVTFPAGGFIRV